MKEKRLFLKAAMFILFVVGGCSKEGIDNPGDGKNVYVINVKYPEGESCSRVEFVELVCNYTTILKVDFVDFGFTAKLPETVDDFLLEKITDNMPKGLKITNPEAKITYLTLRGSNQASKSSSYKYYMYFEYRNMASNGDDTAPETEGDYVYVDSDVKITGTVIEDFYNTPLVYSLALKKGWNLIFCTVDHTHEKNKTTYSNKEPKGMQWWARDNF